MENTLLQLLRENCAVKFSYFSALGARLTEHSSHPHLKWSVEQRRQIFGSTGGDIKDIRNAHDWNNCGSVWDMTDDQKQILAILRRNLLGVCILAWERIGDIASVIWFISLGKITDTFRISQAQSAGTKSKSFVPPPNLGCQMDVQRGLPPPAPALTHFHSPWNSLFISPPPVPHVIHPFLCLFSCLRCVMSGFLMASSPGSLPSWFIFLCHVDITTLSILLSSFKKIFSPLWCVRCSCKPVGLLWLGNRKVKVQTKAAAPCNKILINNQTKSSAG